MIKYDRWNTTHSVRSLTCDTYQLVMMHFHDDLIAIVTSLLDGRSKVVLSNLQGMDHIDGVRVKGELREGAVLEVCLVHQVNYGSLICLTNWQKPNACVPGHLNLRMVMIKVSSWC